MKPKVLKRRRKFFLFSDSIKKIHNRLIHKTEEWVKEIREFYEEARRKHVGLTQVDYINNCG